MPDTRPSLLLRLRDPGDDDAWSAFVSVYGPLVYGACRRRGLRHPDAEDVTQRVFTRILTAIRSFEYQPSRGRFRDWLGIVIRNEVFRFLRDARSIPDAGGSAVERVAPESEDFHWPAVFHDHILRVALERCRPHFESPTWTAFERVWLERRPPSEVALEVNRTVAWVYVAKSRVLDRLERTVLELADEWPSINDREGS